MTVPQSDSDDWKIQHMVDTPEAQRQRFEDIYGDCAILRTETMSLADYKERFGQNTTDEQTDEAKPNAKP